MTNEEIKRIEIDLFLEAVYQRYGYDFRQYARASIRRRIRSLLLPNQEELISELIPKVLYDEAFFRRAVLNFSVTVSEMFRDPLFYKALRHQIIPYLKTFPFIKVWHAGCATGEEVYSLAILLKEEGLYDRCTIFASDFNDDALQRSKEAIYPLDRIKIYTNNYLQAGGREAFSNYYYARYDSVMIDKSLKERITFANHNLVSDGVFGDMHLIFCRNVLIYFNKDLQNRVLRLFYDSLVNHGFLCLGQKESLLFSSVTDEFKAIDTAQSIYQKTNV